MASDAQLAVDAAHGAADVAAASGGIGALGLNAKIFIAQLINFALVLLVLWKWAYQPIVQMLQKREEKIARSVREAEEIEKRLASLDAEQASVLNAAHEEAKKIMEAARETGEAQRAEMVQKAQSEVASVVQKGKAQLVAERDAMVRGAKEDMAAIALAASKKILSDQMDEHRSLQLAEDVVTEMTG